MNDRDKKSLRLWPGITAVALQWLVWLGASAIIPGTNGGMIGAFGGLIGGLLVLVWWVFFSRASWADRLGALALLAVALFVTTRLLHPSIATAGMGFLFPIYAVPTLCLALVVWALLTRKLSLRFRRATMVATLLLASLGWTLVRNNGSASWGSEFRWRWSATAEEQLLSQEEAPTASPSISSIPETAAVWPGFRGADRDGVIPGVRIAADWSASAPVELWRRPVGPGWSSFAVQGDFLFTQEQRGDDEVVACYRAATGEPVWIHRDSARFWEAQGGAGPRGTPTLDGGRVYTFGATGILNALDARDGSVVWSRNVAAETEAKLPYWGLSNSPLVIDDLVVVYTNKLVAYDLADGEPRWSGPVYGVSYSSPHWMTIDGVEQIVMLGSEGAIGVAPSDGTLLWEHAWPGYPIVQPALTADGDLLISINESSGVRRVAVEHGTEGWSVEEIWTSRGLKPYFNDFVVHDGHVYGFDATLLSCIDVEDGERKWKGGRYGNGQLVLLPDQDLLLVLSEQGDLALVQAAPDRFTELARVPALNGKTWNHPVLIGDLLLVRNDREMVAFRLSLAG